MSDYYTQDRSRLQGQPKRTIGEYVRSNGILVPRIFDSFKEAQAAGVPLLARSEHEQEYDGVSGLLESKYGEDITTAEELVPTLLLPTNSGNDVDRYCRYTGTDKDMFTAGISFSFWERIPGVNWAVVADSAVPNRYHLMAHGGEESAQVLNYTVFENGKTQRSYGKALTMHLRSILPAIVGTYESVRSLEHFDINHCPIIEMQTERDNVYFLQYHRTRDFAPTDFALSREGNVFFVRGKTPKEGIQVKATRYYGAYIEGTWDARREEEASFDLHYVNVFSELMVRKRTVQLFSSQGFDLTMRKIASSHIGRSQFFKPEVSIIFNDTGVVSDEEGNEMCRKVHDTLEDATIDLFVQSDGTNAYVERIR